MGILRIYDADRTTVDYVKSTVVVAATLAGLVATFGIVAVAVYAAVTSLLP